MCENEKLIDFVRECPMLYDLRNKDYKDKIKKAETWREIAIKLCLENEAVAQRKWKHLLDSYAKYLWTQSNLAGQYNKKYKQWRWASQMEFIMLQLTTRQTNLKHTDNHSDNDTEIKMESEPTVDEHVQYYEEPINETAIPSLRECKAQQSLCSNVSIYLQTGKLQKCMDAVDLLFLSHAQMLKTFSLRRQAMVKFQIAQIMNNAELTQLEEVNSKHFSS